MDIKKDLYICRQVGRRRPLMAAGMFLHFMWLHLYATLFPRAHFRKAQRIFAQLPPHLQKRLLK